MDTSPIERRRASRSSTRFIHDGFTLEVPVAGVRDGGARRHLRVAVFAAAQAIPRRLDHEGRLVRRAAPRWPSRRQFPSMMPRPLDVRRNLPTWLFAASTKAWERLSVSSRKVRLAMPVLLRAVNVNDELSNASLIRGVRSGDHERREPRAKISDGIFTERCHAPVRLKCPAAKFHTVSLPELPPSFGAGGARSRRARALSRKRCRPQWNLTCCPPVLRVGASHSEVQPTAPRSLNTHQDGRKHAARPDDVSTQLLLHLFDLGQRLSLGGTVAPEIHDFLGNVEVAAAFRKVGARNSAGAFIIRTQCYGTVGAGDLHVSHRHPPIDITLVFPVDGTHRTEVRPRY